MNSIGVGELKADFSHVLEEVRKYGKKYVIEYGKKHKKVAMLVPYEEECGRKLGVLAHLNVEVPDSFSDEDEEINDMFYNGSIFPEEK